MTQSHREPETIPLAALVYDDSADADSLLTQCAQQLARSGRRLAGAVQVNAHRPGRRKCDMRLTDLGCGEETLISYDLGEESEGCRLDPEAFAHAIVLVEQALASGADILIINRFGKQEAQGRGFRPLVAEALLNGIPVLMGVSRQNLDACAAFAGGPFSQLAPDAGQILEWCRKMLA